MANSSYRAAAKWEVRIPKKVEKQRAELPDAQKEDFRTLLDDLRSGGPMQGAWPNYSRLKGDKHHCHLSYRWVVCWEVVDKVVRLIEIYYVGSRKDAPY